MAAYNSQQAVYPSSYVGFDSITQQIEKKSIKRGFQFNIICVGRIGSVCGNQNHVY
jgi:septin 3/9/12